jgi:hypothetical protein
LESLQNCAASSLQSSASGMFKLMLVALREERLQLSVANTKR